MRIHLYCLYNSESVLADNLTRSLSTVGGGPTVLVNLCDNSADRYTGIRAWLNEVLSSIYENPTEYSGSYICFVHQDVRLPRGFFERSAGCLESLSDEHVAVIGLAGIEESGRTHHFMLDSGEFVYSFENRPVEVQTVDEYLFFIDADALLKERVLLSQIPGWHAYAAEFSLVLGLRGYKTYFCPIYCEHNSVRRNNSGLYATHDMLFSIYKAPMRTLVGSIGKYTGLKRFKRWLYGQYVDTFKFRFRATWIDNLKSLMLDSHPRAFRINRYLKRVFRNRECYYLCLAEGNDLVNSAIEIETTTSRIHFRLLGAKDELDNYISESYILVHGFMHRIAGFRYITRYDINLKIGEIRCHPN